ncbi:RNA polymerase sporulation sigma factor SigH [Metabacillus arenae]|uniref:RNA polymerase sporulation sigma factor SigH n=1 Tax=Metabacillus arenae TaxID=2771434 RepID=A0A926NEF8_9BACI|nr:RNA polymerase sporulation sigma factor SigH [Metabacillus arenae]MBD1381989.1 RNA polymerase sporulation sigma factor SigH [Metabacillus arenae]
MSVAIEVELIVNYAKLEDRVLIEMAHRGDSESLAFLINKYQNLVRKKARPYFLIGADKEDLIQEGMIGLYNAIRDFREDKRASFKAFAELCITRQMITAIKSAACQKHSPLNSYFPLDKPLYDEDSNFTLMDMITGEKITNPEALMIHQEKADHIELKIRELLSNLEKIVLTLYMDGKSYMEISAELNIHVKSIDNALQRVKRKLRRHLDL